VSSDDAIPRLDGTCFTVRQYQLTGFVFANVDKRCAAFHSIQSFIDRNFANARLGIVDDGQKLF